MIAMTLALSAILGRAQQATPPADTAQPAAQPAKEKINPPILIKRVVPEYPDSVRARHINARCSDSLTVDINGIPQNITLIRCTDPIFEKYYLDAVSKFRFKPATTQQGKPIAAEINEMIDVEFDGGINLKNLIRYELKTPPGVISSDPSADGVYPLTKSTTPPTLAKFSDEGYGDAAFAFAGNSVCDVVITISAKGKASDPQVTHCERPALDKPAVQSLLKSHYKPGSVGGKAVPMRASIHLEYGGVSPKS